MKTFILCMFLLGTVHSASCQVTGAAALVVLNEVDAMLSEQIQSIDNVVTNAVGNTGNMLLSVSARLRKDINETIGNTDKMLRENQLNLYNQLLNLKDEYNAAIAGNIEQLDVTASKITQTLQDIIVKKKEPIIFQYVTEPYFRDYSKTYTFKVRGKNFDRSNDIYILINGKKIKPVQKNYSDILFKLDSTDINVTPDLYANAKIYFEWEKGLFGKDMVTAEPFIIPVTPLNLGKATAFYEQLLPEKKYSDEITYSCTCRTSGPGPFGGRRRSSTAFNILPTGGRYIDPNSVVETYWDQRHGGGKHFQHITDQQIRGNITCQSESRPGGGGGFSSFRFKYREYETIYKNHTKNLHKDYITSVNPTLFDMPDPVHDKRPNLKYIAVTTYDGKELVLVPQETNRYFRISINPVTDDVVLSWKNN